MLGLPTTVVGYLRILLAGAITVTLGHVRLPAAVVEHLRMLLAGAITVTLGHVRVPNDCRRTSQIIFLGSCTDQDRRLFGSAFFLKLHEGLNQVCRTSQDSPWQLHGPRHQALRLRDLL